MYKCAPTQVPIRVFLFINFFWGGGICKNDEHYLRCSECLYSSRNNYFTTTTICVWTFGLRTYVNYFFSKRQCREIYLSRVSILLGKSLIYVLYNIQVCCCFVLHFYLYMKIINSVICVALLFIMLCVINLCCMIVSLNSSPLFTNKVQHSYIFINYTRIRFST